MCPPHRGCHRSRTASCSRRPRREPSTEEAKGARSALAELRLLTGLLEAGLAPLLDPGVTREEAATLEIAAQLGVDLGQRLGDAVTNRPSLAGDAAAVDADADVDVALVAGHRERLAGHRLVQGTREELGELTAVDAEFPVARHHDDAGDRALALAGGEEAGAGGHFGGGTIGGRGGGLRGGQGGFAVPFLLFLGLEAGAL